MEFVMPIFLANLLQNITAEQKENFLILNDFIGSLLSRLSFEHV